MLLLIMTEQQEHLGCFRSRNDWLSACQLESLSAFDTTQIDTAQQHRELVAPDLDGIELVIGSRDLKGALLQATIPDSETISIPVQNLHAISSTIDEEKQCARERILF